MSKGRQRLQQSSGKAAQRAGEARRRLPGSASPGSHFTTSQQARPALNRGSPASMVDATRALLDRRGASDARLAARASGQRRTSRARCVQTSMGGRCRSCTCPFRAARAPGHADLGQRQTARLHSAPARRARRDRSSRAAHRPPAALLRRPRGASVGARLSRRGTAAASGRRSWAGSGEGARGGAAGSGGSSTRGPPVCAAQARWAAEQQGGQLQHTEHGCSL